MPIYEFVCKTCGQKFEELKTLNNFDARCPVCGNESEKIMSSTSFVVKNSTNTSIDKIVGEDANKRWQAIYDNKNKRQKKQYGNISQDEVKKKESERISVILQKQNSANTVINKAKSDAGITKRDELNHLLKE